jgi:hypothetical protein
MRLFEWSIMRKPRIGSTRRLTARMGTSLLAVGLVGVLGLATVALAGTPAGAASKKSTTKATTKTTTKSSKTAKTSEAAFEKCLSQHGVKLPSRPRTSGSGGGGFPGGGGFGGEGGGGFGGGAPGGGGFGGASPATNSKFAKAFSACRSKLPAGGAFRRPAGGTFTPTPAQQQALTTYESCMNTHGVQIASNATFQTIRSLIASDPTAAAASKDCASDLQGVFRPPDPPTTTSTTAKKPSKSSKK